jgi:hypothetical protein
MRRSSQKLSSEAPVPYRYWEELLSKVYETKDFRIAISGESFSDAPDEVIEQIVYELDPSITRVLITLRPLENILSSQWQQSIQAGAIRKSFEEWLRDIFSDSNLPEKSKAFWFRNRHDHLLQRWSRIIGPDKVIVQVLDSADRGFLFRGVEQMLGLSYGTLKDDGRIINRSLTMLEAEAIRSFYVRLDKLGLGEISQHINYMISPAELIKSKRPFHDEAKIQLPRWALERARVVSNQMVDNIRQSGVVIVGDLMALAPSSPVALEEDIGSSEAMPPDLAGWVAAGVVIKSGIIPRSPLPPGASVPLVWLHQANRAQLIAEVLRRVQLKALRPLESLKRKCIKISKEREEKRTDGK